MTTTRTELKKLKYLLPPDGYLSIFFFPFAYLAACVGTAIEGAKKSNRLSLPSFLSVAEEIEGGGVVGKSDRCYADSRAPGR